MWRCAATSCRVCCILECKLEKVPPSQPTINKHFVLALWISGTLLGRLYTCSLVLECLRSAVPSQQFAFQFNCSDGRYSALGEIWFQTPEASVRSLFHQPEGKFVSNAVQTFCFVIVSFEVLICFSDFKRKLEHCLSRVSWHATKLLKGSSANYSGRSLYSNLSIRQTAFKAHFWIMGTMRLSVFHCQVQQICFFWILIKQTLRNISSFWRPF